MGWKSKWGMVLGASLWVRTKSPPALWPCCPGRGGGRRRPPPEIFFCSFFTFQTILTRFRPKKNFKHFFPREGGRLTTSWGGEIFENFFWSKSTKNGLKREKKQKKNSGGAAPPPLGWGAEIFFYKKKAPHFNSAQLV